LIFSKYLGVSWRHRSFGIALGFGSFAIAEQIAVALRASAYIDEPTLNVVILFAYNVAVIVWMGYMAAKHLAREDKTVLLTTQRWDQSLTDLQHTDAPDSLIPMFEGMVDRAFSRTKEHAFIIESDLEIEKLLVSNGITESSSERPPGNLYPERLPQKT
jgi:hypothetical protein